MTEGQKDLDSLVGQPMTLDGVEDNRFRLGGVVYEAIEDENDGYRSMLGHVAILGRSALKPNIPPVEVALRRVDKDADGYSFDGWEAVTKNGLRILLIGTENYDDWYPCFRFAYTPVGVAAERAGVSA
jgi:hypothetical protein